MLAGFFCSISTASAYDLPVIKAEEPKATDDKANDPKAKKKTDYPMTDKNYVLIGEYKGFKYYLDRYSLKVKKNKSGRRVWSQFIFPIGANVPSINSGSTLQKFFFDGKNAYNSTRKKYLIDEIEDETDREFLKACFKVGYQYAFNEEIKD